MAHPPHTVRRTGLPSTAPRPASRGRARVTTVGTAELGRPRSDVRTRVRARLGPSTRRRVPAWRGFTGRTGTCAVGSNSSSRWARPVRRCLGARRSRRWSSAARRTRTAVRCASASRRRSPGARAPKSGAKTAGVATAGWSGVTEQCSRSVDQPWSDALARDHRRSPRAARPRGRPLRERPAGTTHRDPRGLRRK